MMKFKRISLKSRFTESGELIDDFEFIPVDDNGIPLPDHEYFKYEGGLVVRGKVYTGKMIIENVIE